MDEVPEIPTPVPEIPRVALWSALSIPPLATLFGNLIVSCFHSLDTYGLTFLFVPVGVFALICVCLPTYNQAVGKRYRGQSKLFLGWAYFLGQIIVCLALWFGSCLLFMR